MIYLLAGFFITIKKRFLEVKIFALNSLPLRSLGMNFLPGTKNLTIRVALEMVAVPNWKLFPTVCIREGVFPMGFAVILVYFENRTEQRSQLNVFNILLPEAPFQSAEVLGILPLSESPRTTKIWNATSEYRSLRSNIITKCH